MAINTKLGEGDITDVVLYVLIDKGRMDTTEMKREIRRILEPEADNLTPLLHRNDQAIDQIIRNIVSHKNDSSRNIIYRGLVDYDDGIWEITDRGRDVFEQGMKRRYERELNV